MIILLKIYRVNSKYEQNPIAEQYCFENLQCEENLKENMQEGTLYKM